MEKPTRIASLGLLVLAILVLSVVATTSQAGQASALSAVTFTNRGTVTSDNSAFQKLYYDSGATALQFLDTNGQGQVTQDTFKTSTNTTTSFTNPLGSAITRQVPTGGATASSSTIGHGPSNATDNNISTYWRTGNAGERPFRTSIMPNSQYYFNGNTNDAIGSNNLVAQGSPTYGVSSPSGVSGKYIKFDGATQFANATSNTIFDVGTESFSLWGAFYLTSSPGGAGYYIVSKGAPTGSTSIGYGILVTSAGKLSVDINANAGSGLTSAISSTTIVANNWYIWGASYDRTNSETLYLYDTSSKTLEAKATSIIGNAGSISTSNDFTVGRRSNGSDRFLPGYMDNLSFLDNIAITQAQFQEIVDRFALPTSLYRFSGNGNDSFSGNTLTAAGSPTYSAVDQDIFGQYVTLDGATQYFQPSPASNTLFDVGTEDFTMHGFFQRTSDSGVVDHILRKKSTFSSATAGYEVQINGSDQFQVGFSDGSASTIFATITTPTVNLNTWYFWIATFNRSGSLTLYLYNLSTGQYVTTSAIISTEPGSASNTQTFTLGKDSSSAGSFFPGSLDNFGFIDGTALTQQQVGKLISIYTGAGGTGEAPAQGLPTPTDFYRFSGDLTDSVGGNTLTNNNGATFAGAQPLGPYGQYLALDGSTQYLSAANSGVYNVTTQDFSFSGFFYLTNANAVNKVLVEKIMTNTGFTVFITTALQLRANIGDAGGQITTTVPVTLTAGKWYFWAASYDRDNNCTLYLLDTTTGTLTTQSSNISTKSGDISNSQIFKVGRASNTPVNYFPGYMDNLEIYIGTALSATQVQSLYSSYIYGDLGATKTVTGVNLYQSNPVEIPAKVDVYVSNSSSFPEAARQTFSTFESSQTRYYRFDYGSLTDSSGNGANLAIVGTPTFVSGKYGNAFSFDGSTDLNTSTGSLAQPITVSGWIYPTLLDTTKNIMSRVSGSGDGFRIQISTSGVLSVFWESSGGDIVNLSSTRTAPLNAWTHFAVTFDSSTAKIYINGVFSGSDSYSGTLNTATGLYLGRNYLTTSNRFVGYMDDVHTNNRVLSQTEIQNIMKNTNRYYTFTLQTPVVGQYVKTQVNTWMPTNAWTANEYNINIITPASSNTQVSDIETTNTFYSTARSGSINTNTFNGRTLSTDGLVGWYSFNDNSGTDSSGFGNNGTPAGDVLFAPGKFGDAAYFDGNGDYIEVPDSPSQEAQSAITISAWINPSQFPDSTNVGPVLRKQTESGDKSIYSIWVEGSARVTPGRIVFSLNSGSTQPQLTSVGQIPLNSWTHVVATWSTTSNTMRIYWNGTQNTSGSASGAGQLDASTKPLEIGKYASGSTPHYFFGGIDDLRIYNKEFSSTEVSNLYNAALTPRSVESALTPTATVQSVSNLYVPLINSTGNGALKLGAIPKNYGTVDVNSGLIGYWKFDEGSGTSASDSSTMGNTGTLTGGTITWTPNGIRNKAITTDGTTNNYVIIPNGPSINTLTGDLSIDMWFKRAQTQTSTSEYLMSSSDNKWHFRIDSLTSGKLRFYWDNTHSISGLGPAITDTLWHNVVVTTTFDGTTTTASLYLDGLLLGSQSSTGDSSIPGASIRIGVVAAGTSAFNGNIDDVRIYNRALSLSDVRALYYGEYPLYTGTGSVPVYSSGQVKSVVTNDGASENVYTAFQYNATSWRVVKFATATQTATLLSTPLVNTVPSPQFNFFPISGKIVAVTGNKTWEINTSTDAITQVFPVFNPNDFDEDIPAGFQTWITNVPQTFTLSSGARTYSPNTVYLGSNYEARTYTPSTGAGPTMSYLFSEAVDPGLNTGQILLHRPAQYYYYLPFLNLTIEPSGTTWTIKSVGSSSSLTLDAYHEFTQTVVKDPFQAYEGVSYVYCGDQNYNFTAPQVAFSSYADCTHWHVYSHQDLSQDPIPREIPFATTGATVHAFDYTHYTFNLYTDTPTAYQISSYLGGKLVDTKQVSISGVTQQSWLYGNCYDVVVQNIIANTSVVAGNMCANDQTTITLNLLTLNIPTNSTTNGWVYNVTRAFNVGGTGNSTVIFTVDANPHPYVVNIEMTDHYLDNYQTFHRWFNYTGMNSTITVNPSVYDNQTVYFIVYDGNMVPRVTASSFGKTLNLQPLQLALQPMGNVFGISPFAFFIVLAAGIFVKSNASIGIITVGSLAGLMFAGGLITLTDTLWGVVIAMVALGAIYAAKKVF